MSSYHDRAMSVLSDHEYHGQRECLRLYIYKKITDIWAREIIRYSKKIKISTILIDLDFKEV
jgi:hypothetical protein